MAGNVTMDDLLTTVSEDLKQVVEGETVTGKVMSVKKHEILIDLGPKGVGMVPRREAAFEQELEPGQEVTASVIEEEMPSGEVLLSLRKAAKDKSWDEILTKMEAGDIVEVEPTDANRGGLLAELEGIRGFLPVSQLAAEH